MRFANQQQSSAALHYMPSPPSSTVGTALPHSSAQGAQPLSPLLAEAAGDLADPTAGDYFVHTLWEGQSAHSLFLGNVIQRNDFPECNTPQTNKQVKQQAEKQKTLQASKQKHHHHLLTKQTQKEAGLASRLREHCCNAPWWKKGRNPASGKKGWRLGGHTEQFCTAPTLEPCLAAAHLASFLQPKVTHTLSTALTIAVSHTTPHHIPETSLTEMWDLRERLSGGEKQKVDANVQSSFIPSV